MSYDQEGILKEINRKILQTCVNFPVSFNSFSSYWDTSFNTNYLNISGRRQINFHNNFELQAHSLDLNSQSQRNWLTYFQFDNMIHLKEIDFKFSREFLANPTNLMNLIEKKLMKLTNLTKIKFEMFYDWIDNEVTLDIIKLIEKNSHSLQILSLNQVSMGLKWEQLSMFFKSLQNMKKMICFNLNFIDEKVIIRANISKLFRFLKDFFKKTPDLISFDFKARFGDSSLFQMNEEYAYFLRIRKIFFYLLMAFKKNVKARYFRKEIFIEIFLKFLMRNKPHFQELKSEVYQISNQSRNEWINYDDGEG